MTVGRPLLSAEDITAAGFHFGHPLEEACELFEAVDFLERGKRVMRTRSGSGIGTADSFEPFDFFACTPLPMGPE